MTKKSFVASIGLAFSVTMSVGFVNITPKVIYGEDGRQEVYEVENAALRDLADSTVALISKSNMSPVAGGMMSIKARTFGQELRLCPSEPYADQPSAANCSGSLVGEDLIATAGHCISKSDCSRYNFVFGFRMENANTATTLIPADDIYTCKEIIAREYKNAQDYALIRLDRPVRGHQPLTLAKNRAEAGDEVFVIGHPAGIPTKVTSGGTVRSQEGKFFVTNLDTYGGNSGSAVFNAATHEVVGILVRGDEDFKMGAGGCRVSNVCEEDGCRGEDVTNISYISSAMNRVRR